MRIRRRLTLACLLTLTCLLTPASAASWPSLRDALLAKTEVSRDDWAEVMRLLGDPDQGDDVRSVLEGLDQLPRTTLAAMLDHPELAVRLGALDWLETATRNDFGFDPWRTPGDPVNTQARRQWQAWAQEEQEIALKSLTLTDDDARAAFRQLLSGRREQEDRAMRSLEPYGLDAIRRLETFRNEHGELQEGARSRLRQAQYFLLLRGLAKGEAQELARRLAFGSRDQRLAAITRLKELGESGLPILADFAQSPDTLIRETAVDVMLYAGTGDALDKIKDDLDQESDTNVIHAAIRQMADIPTETSRVLLGKFTQHPDEDVVIEALTALSKLNWAKPALVLPALADSRWRVRVAALGCIQSNSDNQVYRERLVQMLSDEDEFVRAAAVDAVAIAYEGGRGSSRRFGWGQDHGEDFKQVREKLRKLFEQDTDFTAPVINAWLSWEQPLPKDLINAIRERPAEALFPLLESLTSSRANTMAVIKALAEHPAMDLRVGAYRLLARQAQDKPEVVALIVDAINNGPAPIRQAALQGLRIQLDSHYRQQGEASLKEVTTSTTRQSTSLDPLYDAFLQPLRDPAVGIEPAEEEEEERGDLYELTGSLAELAKALHHHYQATEDDTEKFQCLCFLLTLGKQEAMRDAVRTLAERPVNERVALLEALRDSLHARHLDLLGKSLRDPVGEVRTEAIGLCLAAKARGAIQLLFQELNRPETLLQAHEIYAWQLSWVLQRADAAVGLDWSKNVLAESETHDAKTVLAVLMMALSPLMPEDVVVQRLSSPNQWVRRAAVFALATQRPAVFHQQFVRSATDRAAKVRAAAAHALIDVRSHWYHYFDDVHKRYSVSPSTFTSMPRIPRGLRKVLELLVRDPSAEVRFEAMLALLQLDQPVDIGAFTTAARELPQEIEVGQRVANFLQRNQRRLGPRFRPLLALVGKHDLNQRRRAEIGRRLRGNRPRILTFADLAIQASETPRETGTMQLTPAPPTIPQEQISAFEVIYFHSPGCPDCDRVRRHLQRLQESFPGMTLVEKNIRLPENTVLNRALCIRFGVPSRLQNVTPAVFTETGFAIGENAKAIERLEPLILQTSLLPHTADWVALTDAETEAAARAMQAHFQSLTLGIVLAAGLLDGINPCAFATIIFFLSYLQIARRSPREILMVGGAFILSVFSTYLLIGLALNEVIGHITKFQWARLSLNLLFAFFALLVMILSYRDCIRARRGDLKAMTLQLPDALKTRIRRVIRTGAKSSHFVIAALISGVVISLLELACTGQIYAPIIYAIQQGSKSAIAYLVSYNFAFILPLIIIFALAYGGLRSDALIRFQKKHTAGVKFAMGTLFLLLFLLLVGTSFV